MRTQHEGACGDRWAKDPYSKYSSARWNTGQHRVVWKWGGTQPYYRARAGKFVPFLTTLCY